MCHQCSATELRQPDNHQLPQSFSCTAPNTVTAMLLKVGFNSTISKHGTVLTVLLSNFIDSSENPHSWCLIEQFNKVVTYLGSVKIFHISLFLQWCCHLCTASYRFPQEKMTKPTPHGNSKFAVAFYPTLPSTKKWFRDEALTHGPKELCVCCIWSVDVCIYHWSTATQCAPSF